MPEGKIEKEEKPYEWGRNALREHSAKDIQAAIAKALSELTGEPFDASVMNLDFAPKWAGLNAKLANSAECVLRIRARHDDDSPF